MDSLATFVDGVDLVDGNRLSTRVHPVHSSPLIEVFEEVLPGLITSKNQIGVVMCLFEEAFERGQPIFQLQSLPVSHVIVVLYF
jgi:hypothetical protein